MPRLLPAILNYLPFGVLAAWILVFGTPYENTLNLSAAGRIDFNTAWFYRFRDSGFATPSAWNPALPVFLWIVHFTGTRIFWTGMLLLQALVLQNAKPGKRLAFLSGALAGILFGEAPLLWSAALLFSWNTLRLLRNPLPLWKRAASSLAAVFFTLLALALANPVYYVNRQRVLGGKSALDLFRVYDGGRKIALRENCAAVVHPDDLRGVNSLEALQKTAFAAFAAIELLDLRVVEQNYRLLSLKDEKGKYIFSDAARDFAKKEMAHAEGLTLKILTRDKLCLIANFDTLPEAEAAPFSRARKILEMRRQAKLETRVIQLPGR